MTIRRYRNGDHQARGNVRRPFRHARRVQKIGDSATAHSSLLPDHYFIWDPSEPVATRPLVWKRGTSVAYYTHDGNKNVSEVIASNNDVAAHYEYAPFGALTISRGVSAADNPWRFSSEYAEDDTATVYYNYRHYEPVTGRWMQRDFAEDLGALNLYAILNGNPISHIDLLGLKDGMTTRGGGYKCTKLSGQTFSAHKEFMVLGAQLHFDMDLSIEGKKCKKCCKDGTARSGQEVFDEDFSIAVTGKISGGKGTIWKKFDSSDFGGWWAAPNVKGELYAGIKIEGFGLFSVSGNVGTDRCDNHELSGGVCMQGQVGLALSGGAVFDMYWNSAHFKAGAEVTGMITASLSRCIVCNSDGCSLGKTQVCVEGDVSAHLYLMFYHINYSLYNKGKCWEF